jgi:hypothetical protein
VTPASLFAQYLNYRREAGEYLGPADPAKLRMLKIFLPKLEKQIAELQEPAARAKCIHQLVFFKHALFYDLAEFDPFFANIEQNLAVFEFSEHITQLARLVQDDAHWEAQGQRAIGLFLTIIKEQLKETTIANYNMQIDFLTQIFRRVTEDEIKACVGFLSTHPIASIDEFIDTMKLYDGQQFTLSYLQLISQYLDLFVRRNKDQFRSKNYLLLVLFVLKELLSKHPSSIEFFSPLIDDLVSVNLHYYQNTLTVVDELYPLYSSDSHICAAVKRQLDKVLEQSAKPLLQCTLGYQRMMIELWEADLADLEEHKLVDFINRFLARFALYEDEFYKGKQIKVDKGDRLNHDNYLFAAIEILRVGQLLHRSFSCGAQIASTCSPAGCSSSLC